MIRTNNYSKIAELLKKATQNEANEKAKKLVEESDSIIYEWYDMLKGGVITEDEAKAIVWNAPIALRELKSPYPDWAWPIFGGVLSGEVEADDYVKENVANMMLSSFQSGQKDPSEFSEDMQQLLDLQTSFTDEELDTFLPAVINSPDGRDEESLKSEIEAIEAAAASSISFPAAEKNRLLELKQQLAELESKK
jgi:hypothetical protein